MTVDSIVGGCMLHLDTITTIVDICILPLGSYEIVLGMDRLAIHQVNIDCQHKLV